MLKLLKILLLCFTINQIKSTCDGQQYMIYDSSESFSSCGTEEQCPQNYFIYPDNKECGRFQCPTSGKVIRKSNSNNDPCYGCSDSNNYLDYDSHECVSCSNYKYIDNNGLRLCIDNCNRISLLRENDGVNCITACDISTTSTHKFEYQSICYNNCPTDTRSDDPSSSTISPNIYLCRAACESPLPFFDSTVATYPYCYSKCPNSSKKKYQDPNKVNPPYECKASCSEFSSTGYIFEKDDICLLKCPDESPYYGSDKNCIPECINTGFLYHDYGSYECKSSCGSLFEFNYVCYTSCPSGTKRSSSGNKCECLGKYEINSVSSEKTIVTCENDAPCPVDKKYFFETDNKCLTEEEANDIGCSIRRTLKTSPQNIQCLTEC